MILNKNRFWDNDNGLKKKSKNFTDPYFARVRQMIKRRFPDEYSDSCCIRFDKKTSLINRTNSISIYQDDFQFSIYKDGQTFGYINNYDYCYECVFEITKTDFGNLFYRFLDCVGALEINNDL